MDSNEKFKRFLIDWKEKNWKGNQSSFAEYIGIKRQNLSNIITGKTGTSEEARLKICEKLKVDYWTIVKTQKDNKCKIIELQKPYKHPSNQRYVDMHKKLDMICDFGDEGLIGAIEANLNSFSEIAELKKTVHKQSDQIKEQDGKMKLLEDRLKIMEVKSG